MKEIWAPTYGAEARDLEQGGAAAAAGAHAQPSRRSVVRRWGIVIELFIHRFDEAVFAYCVRGVGQANFESRASDSNDPLRLTAAETGGNLMLLAAYIARNDVAEARDLGNLWLLFLLSGFQVASEPLRASSNWTSNQGAAARCSMYSPRTT